MRTTKKHIIYLVLALLFSVAANAQMLNNNKLTEARIHYVQFPTEGAILNSAYVQFTDTQEGAMAMLNRAVQQKMGTAGGPNITKENLCSPIFCGNGDLSVVITAREPKLKEQIDFLAGKAFVVYGADIKNSPNARENFAIASFQVFKDDKVIYSQEPTNIAGYKNAAPTTSTGGAGGGLSSLSAVASTISVSTADNFPHEELALAWVSDILKNRYGMRMGSINVKPYYISGLKSNNKKKALELSEILVNNCVQFQYKMGDKAYNKSLEEAITFYKSLEVQFSEDKKAEINKKNLWQIQSNLAIAYFLSENTTEAKAYMEKALASKNATIVKKESENGKAGFSAGMAISYLQFAPAFIQACDNYQKGLDANPSAFVTQFIDQASRNAINDKAQELVLAYGLAGNYGYDIPVNIYDCGGDIKKVTGTISIDDNDFNYKYNKIWYSFIQKLLKKNILYVTKVQSASNTKDKLKFVNAVNYNDWSNKDYTIRPFTYKDRDFNMVSSFSLGDRGAKTLLPAREYEDFVTKKQVRATNRKVEAVSFPMNLIMKSEDKVYVNVKFDTNNNIILAIRNERDMPGFEYGKVDLEPEEVLFYDEITNIYQFNNSELSQISSTSRSVVRERASKLPLDAKVWKETHLGQLLQTTVTAEESHKAEFNVAADKINIVNDGITDTVKKSITKSGDNWTTITNGNTTITRTIM